MPIILPAFKTFAKEGETIGRLLAGYGELEFEMCLAVGMAIGEVDTAIKAMFRPRGESQRIDIGDALGHKAFASINLEREFSEAIGGIRYCLKIRNQFAHCNWHDDNTGKLGFVNFEEIAIKRATILDLARLTVHYLDVALLECQEAYFCLIQRWFTYLNFEAQHWAGRIANQPIPVPEKALRPPLCIPPLE